MLQKLMEGTERGYVTLDDLNERNIAKTDPELFLQLHKPPVLIDEVQYAPELFTYIKINVDKNHEPGAFWLTGSQVFKLMQRSTGVTGRKSGSTYTYIPVTGRDIRRNDGTVYDRSGGFKRESRRERAS
ncbi:MAG: AAA family ATPase [Waltera sp.]